MEPQQDKPEELENKVLDKRMSFSVKDLKWVITSGVAIILWIVTSIFWVKDKNAQSDKIKLLEDAKVQLEKQVATLEGQVKGVENASTIFMQNPPSELKFRIDLLEKRVDYIENPNHATNPNTTSFKDTSHVIRRNL